MSDTVSLAEHWLRAYPTSATPAKQLIEGLLATVAALTAENAALREELEAMTELARAAWDDALPPDELVARLRERLRQEKERAADAD